jgi:lysine decarboxylase
MQDAVGEVSAEQFCPYPPGIPLVAPGERVTADVVANIREAGRSARVAYCSDPTLRTIEVVT